MLESAKLKHFGVGFLIVALLLAFFNIPTSIAAYSNVSDTISDSRVSISASHVITFTTASDIGANGYYEITFAQEYGDNCNQNKDTPANDGPDSTDAHQAH